MIFSLEKLQYVQKITPSPLPRQVTYPSNPHLVELKDRGKGKILCIVGNGPSHKLADLPQLLGKVDFLCVNKPDERIYPPEYWVIFDKDQIDANRDKWDDYQGFKIGLGNTVSRYKCSIIGGLGFATDISTGLYMGFSSVYASMQIGIYMGYEKVYIFGCDMGKVDNKLYAWGSNPFVKDEERLKRFENEAKSYQWAVENLPQDIKNRLVFCSQFNHFPFVKLFPNMTYEDAISRILL